jgi:hypothetical protein
MPKSGMWCRLVLSKFTDVSEELTPLFSWPKSKASKEVSIKLKFISTSPNLFHPLWHHISECSSPDKRNVLFL